ncbi:MAG: type I restriction endonuclease subunit R, partial [Bacteroidetes bacterium]|nr:type I restriction endonuclease subunit R [Bacteroidota bacterium]
MSKQTDTTEKGLEAHISQYLTDENNYLLRENKVYDKAACLDSQLFFQFLEATQPKAVEKLKAYHKDLYEQKVTKRLNDQVQAKGIIEVLRKGIIDGYTDTKLNLFYDKPVTAYNTDANALFEANLFSVMRQVYFSPNDNKSLDMVVFINGIPIISFELKNELTKQNVQQAIEQYKNDRDPNEELFRLGRLMVNFAVDTEEIWMC